ncbi:MAG: DUF2520 domain-containing protein [Alphaproteobacteria bacterium]|nr:DUF2520 domain-containing protein [Alphaproteobacteria bacterium]
MRQVPYYLIIGNGRMARHFRHYLSLLGITSSQWNRSESPTLLKEFAQKATHILVLINDNAIEPFITKYLQDFPAIKVHFSGSLVSEKAYGVHPLMTFNTSLYTLDKYLSVSFVVDATAPPFETLLPGLSNQHVTLAPEHKAKYHAICVLGGNFSCLLWQKFFTTLESEFHLPAEIGHAYLRQQMENLLTDHSLAFAGPLVRGDVATIQKNFDALEGDPFQHIYQDFVEVYNFIKEKK